MPLSQTNIQSDFVQNGLRSPDQLYVTPEENKSIFLPPDDMSFSDQFEPGSAPSTVGMFDDTDTIGTLNSMATEASSLSSGQSPRLVDLLLPGTDMNATPAEYITWRSQYPDSLYQPASYNTMMDAIDPGLGQMQEDDVEEIIRDQPFQFNFDNVNCMMRRSSPSPSSSSTSSSGSTFFSSFLREPIFDASSPEMLTRKFDRETCGILSVKDGPTENPWRTLVWPLARDSPALYHAIASMTCFHTSKTQPQLRLPGIDHMRTAVQSLATGIQNMRFDAAIATTLVLAFAESWDQHTSTGINHIKGAKILVNQALVQLRTQPNIPKEEFDRLRFLCNTWIYMDVIARLTAVDDDQSNDFDVVTSMLSFGPNQADTHLDPLMGCATSLFPILGRVANLVRRVWHSESNSPAIISQAMELKNRLEAWEPPAILEDPEDPTSPAVDSIQTAEAYRWATLLYLHQAVPEIPSLSSAELAKKVMVYLATVPPGSRATIVQIYPLLVAGCEAVGEDREWVIKRWEFMAQRMVIGTIPRCGEVTKEVWDRRDAREAEKARLKSRAKSFSLKREYKGDHSDPFGWMNGSGFGLNPKKRAAGGSTLDMPIPKASKKDKRSQSDIGGYEKLDPELTVRGPLHWVRVMQEWKWESKLHICGSIWPRFFC